MSKMRLAINEFQALVNRQPIATVNFEARSHALEYYRSQITCIDLVCDVDQYCGLVTVENEIVEPIFLQPSIVTITLSREHYYIGYYNPDYTLEDIEEKDEPFIPMVFSSAEDLVDVVHRICGNGVEHIILDSTFDTCCTLKEMYRPHTLQGVIANEDMYVAPLFYATLLTDSIIYGPLVFVDDSKYEQFEVIMTPDRVAFIDNDLKCSGNLYDLEELYRHLLKFYELLDASKQKLPALRTIELNLETIEE